jgi:hypothetical protein
MERQTLAYLIMVVVAATLAGWAVFQWYYARERTYRRRLAREAAAYQRMIAENAELESLE